MHERARNAPIAMDLAAADAAICPTALPGGAVPAGLPRRPDRAPRRHRHRPLPARPRRAPTRRSAASSPPTRRSSPTPPAAWSRIAAFRSSWPPFRRSSPPIRRAVAVIAGENRVAYGGDALRGTDWKATRSPSTTSTPARVHFTGRLARADYLRLLRRSDAHVYLTVPFVLSWSMLEAMSTGCALVLSDTDPVREFADAAPALVDLAHPATIATAVIALLSGAPDVPRRANARETVRASLASPSSTAERPRFSGASAPD